MPCAADKQGRASRERMVIIWNITSGFEYVLKKSSSGWWVVLERRET